VADLVSHTEAPAWLSGDGSHDTELWTEVFDTQVQQGAPAEPKVVPVEEIHLTEPSLDAPIISADAAEAASLPETAAEVRAVSEEAAEAGKQAGIPEPAPEGTEIAVDAGEGVTVLDPETTEPTGDADAEAGDPAAEAGDAAAEAGDPDAEAGDAEAKTGDPDAEAGDAEAKTGDPDAEAGDAEAKAGDAADPTEEPAEGGADAKTSTAATEPEQPAEPEQSSEPEAPQQSADVGETVQTADAEEAGEAAEAEPGDTTAPEADAAEEAGTGAHPTIATSTLKSDSNDVAAPVTDSFASLSLTKKVATEDPADTGITHKVNPSGSTAVPADSRRARRTREAEEAAAKSNGTSRTTRMLALIGSILVIVLLGIWLATIVADSNRGDGVLEDSVAPVDLDAGACLQDFKSVNADVTVVTCDTEHNAQLVATQSYPGADAFPGADALAAKAEEVCSSVMYTDGASKYSDLELNRAVPTQSSWDAGDRRVDCFVVSPSEELTESLIVQP